MKFKIDRTRFCSGGWLTFHSYRDGSLMIRIDDDEGPQCVATVCLPVPPDKGCVWIKDWSENEGVLDAFIRCKHAMPTYRLHRTGFVVAYEVRLSQEILNEIS